MEKLEEGQLVLCVVEKIIGTTVFVKIENEESLKEGPRLDGTITFSEIAPGRIRNLRDYVVPGKKIVCKILEIKDDHLILSLRRVGEKEKKEFLEKINREKSNKTILETVLGEEECKKFLKEVLKTQSISEFFESVRNNPDILNTCLTKEKAEKLKKIIESKKEKPKEIKQIFKLSSKEPNGIVIVKNIINESCKEDCYVNYIAAGKYSLSLQGKDYKEIRNKINSILEEIEKRAKKNHCEFIVEKTKS